MGMGLPKTTRQTPRIFISHSSKDIDFVKRLANDLCYILGDDDAVWFDVLGLNGGDAWWPKIVREIKARDIFILVISPDAMKSPWVDDELQIAWRHKNAKTAAKKLLFLFTFVNAKRFLATWKTFNGFYFFHQKLTNQLFINCLGI